MEILDQLDLRVLHPAEFVRELDTLQRAEDYAPVRLAGTRLELRNLRVEDLDLASQTLRYGGAGERDSVFRNMIREGFQGRSGADVLWVGSNDGSAPLGMLVGHQHDEAQVYEVVALRVPQGGASHSAEARALARHLAYLTVERATSRGCNVIEVVDTHLHPAVRDGLRAEGFGIFGAAYGRVVIRGILDRSELFSELAGIARQYSAIVVGCTGGTAEFLERLTANDPNAHVRVAERIGTVKVLPLALPCYVLPIQPRWAEHLFDSVLAGQGLFGADTRLGLAREAVYYRSAHGIELQAPAFILWYVSHSEGREGTKAIRACSMLRRIEVDEARNLYRRNKRLGVWQWVDVLSGAKGDPKGALMALTFQNTELFASPVSYSNALELLGSDSTFQGPLAITPDQFVRVYRDGTT